MSYPQQPWQQPGPGQPPGQYPNIPSSSGPGGWPQYQPGPAGPPRLNLGALDQAKIAAASVVVSAAIVLIGSLFSLYSIAVTPSGAAVRNNDAPAGTVEVGIGFFDVVPFPAPVIATAIPLLMLLAALTAAPAILGGGAKVTGLPAVFAGAGALLSIVLSISNPLPTVDISGQLAAELSQEVGGRSLGELTDSVVSVGPGAGLILAALFGVTGRAAAVVMLFRRAPSGQVPPPATRPQSPTNPYGPPPQPHVPPRW